MTKSDKVNVLKNILVKNGYEEDRWGTYRTATRKVDLRNRNAKVYVKGEVNPWIKIYSVCINKMTKTDAQRFCIAIKEK